MSDIAIVHIKYPEEIHRSHHVRHKVFVIEQGYSTAVETDNEDHICQHWVATYQSKDVGTVRLWPKPNGVAKLGRLSVVSEARGLHIGQKLVKEFIEYCKKNEFNTIVLHAQYPKRGFYEKLGFVVEKDDDEIFEEGGTPHVRMWMRNL